MYRFRREVVAPQGEVSRRGHQIPGGCDGPQDLHRREHRRTLRTVLVTTTATGVEYRWDPSVQVEYHVSEVQTQVFTTTFLTLLTLKTSKETFLGFFTVILFNLTIGVRSWKKSFLVTGTGSRQKFRRSDFSGPVERGLGVSLFLWGHFRSLSSDVDWSGVESDVPGYVPTIRVFYTGQAWVHESSLPLQPFASVYGITTTNITSVWFYYPKNYVIRFNLYNNFN